MLSICTVTASGVGILYSFARVVPEAEIFVEELQQWIVSFFSLTLATNIICTGGCFATAVITRATQTEGDTGWQASSRCASGG